MNNPLQITFRDIEPSAAVTADIERCFERLAHVCGRITNCRVVVEWPHKHHLHGRLFHVRVELAVPGKEIVADRPHHRAEHEDVYVAIHGAFRAARRELADFVRIRRDGDTRGAGRAAVDR